MSQRIFIKPTALTIEGETTARLVRKPNGERLKAEGEAVTLDTFWQRRLNDLDVELAEQPAESPPVAAAPIAAPVAAKSAK